MSPNDVNVILARLDAMHEDISEVKEQVKTTNGRVTSLEQWKSFMDGMRAGRAWAQPLVLSIVSGGIVGGIVKLLG